MTRDKKIAKLVHAIQDYRGKYNEQNGKWINPPQPHRLEAVVRWADRLLLDPKAVVAKVDAFRHYDEFHTWIKGL